ncbi:hypothetical protein BSF41_22600 [Flavobacterium sp. ACN2]|jgi:hypothetical protein|nr:hypothetical protein [Flavobacterium sp. ACN2]PBI88892.1 hypothetical protein BSF41_22600 [Flavobacterium sp. ACN2]
MKTENLELEQLNEIELIQIEGGSHLKDFVEGIACGLAFAGFLASVL